MKKIKVYISGKVTGLDEAFELFEKAEKSILAPGIIPINPMKLNHDHDKLWESYMKVCIKELCDCDIVCTLSNYTESRGAIIEVGLAKQLNIPVCSIELFNGETFKTVLLKHSLLKSKTPKIDTSVGKSITQYYEERQYFSDDKITDGIS